MERNEVHEESRKGSLLSLGCLLAQWLLLNKLGWARVWPDQLNQVPVQLSALFPVQSGSKMIPEF